LKTRKICDVTLRGGVVMGISINVTFLLASLIVFWIIPAIGIAKKHLVDDRFFYSPVVISNAILVTTFL
jgi:hypothetical protein